MRTLLFIFVLLVLQRTAVHRVHAQAPETIASGSHHDVQFSEPAPYSSPSNLVQRLGFLDSSPAYDIGAEKFLLVLPSTYSTNLAWGLLVWVSASNDPKIGKAWELELAKRHLLFVGAYQSGNTRESTIRCRLALDALCNMARQYRIDRRRIFIAGFSGGARLASLLGVAYGDIITGTLCICGVDFYQAVPAATGGFYPASYRPDPKALFFAKSRDRFVLLTGEFDMNRDNTRSTAELGFQRSGFKNILYVEVPGMKHALPGASEFGAALDFLSGGTP